MTLILRIASLGCFILSLAAFAEESVEVSDKSTQHRYREEPLQWTAMSITVISAAEIEETYRRDLTDLEGLAPGLLVDSLSSVPYGATVALRGVASNNEGISAFAAIPVSVDGVFLGTHANQNQALFDLASVEVIRGSGGTFRGGPAAGGSVNLYRTRPSRELTARTRASFGDYNRKRFDGVFTFPILDSMAGKLSFNWKRGNAETIINQDSFRKENEDHYSAGSVALIWQRPDGNFLQYTYDSVQDKSDVPALLNLSVPGDLLCDTQNLCSEEGNGTIPETGSIGRTSQNYSNIREYNINQHALHFGFELAGHEVKGIIASRKSDEDSNQDLDATSADFYSVTLNRKYEQVSQELSVFRQLTPTFSYMVGAYYLSQSLEQNRYELYILNVLSDAGILAVTGPDETRHLYTQQETRLRSVFGQLDYQLNEQWTLDAGVKWNELDHDFYHVASLPGTANATEIDTFEPDDEITGSIGLAYRVDNDASLYFRYSHSVRPGGHDDQANSVDGAEIGEEDTDALEMGIKTQWLDDRLRINYVVYRNSYRNKAERVTQVASSGMIESVFSNVATIENRGHEIEIEAVPFDNLSFRAALSHMNADYVNYRVPDLIDPANAIDKETLITPFSPTDMFHFSGRYSFPYGEGTVRLYAGYRFTTEYWSNSDVPTGRIDNFTLLDFSAEFEWREWTFRLFSKNANSKRYLTNVSRIDAARVASLPSTTTSARGLMTTAEVNQPEFTGFEVIYVPRFGR
ncbi:MAG: TonB-dependent receptor [Pseudomonadales bacterium]